MLIFAPSIGTEFGVFGKSGYTLPKRSTMNWKDEKDRLEKLILDERVSYIEIGKMYGCSDNNIKKVARRLGIELPKRRNISTNETFNKGTAKMNVCPTCGKEFRPYYKGHRYCSKECSRKGYSKEKIEKWKSGEEDGTVSFTCSRAIRRYLMDKYNNTCQMCGWGRKNEYTDMVPLQVHHIDGNSLNNKEENLQLLCPNCHSLTENFGSRNKNATKGRSEYYGKKAIKEQ